VTRIKYIIISLCALLPLMAEGQEFIAYRDSVPDGYNFWLSVPAGYDTLTVDIPVVIFLHGRSLCGKDLNRVLRYGPLDAIKRGRELEALVIAPQNPGNPWNPRKVDNVLEWVMERYNGDRERVYVLGMSLGGYGTLDFVGTYPEKVAAAIALCGGTTLKDVDGLRKVPLMIVHGVEDERVSVKYSRQVVNGMMACGDTPLLYYDWMPGRNHSDLARFFYMPAAYEWLFGHTLSERKLLEPFPHTWAEVSAVYRNWGAKGRVIVSDPPRKGYVPVRRRHSPDSLALPAVFFSVDSMWKARSETSIFGLK